MANLMGMSMRMLLGGGRRKYCNMATGATRFHLNNVSRKFCNMAAAATRFHPNKGGGISIINGSESPIPAGKSPLPLLIVPPEMVTDIAGEETDNHYNFMRVEKQPDSDHIHKKLFMVHKNTSYNNLPWEELSLPDDAICRGSSHGWLAFVHPDTRDVGLFNPFLPKSKVSFPYIPLPRTDTIFSYSPIRQVYKEDNTSDSPSLISEHDGCSLVKFALSSAPHVDGGDCNVVGISEYEKRLVFCKLGDSAWINLIGSYKRYSDVVYFSKDGHFYAVTDDQLVFCDGGSLYDDKPFDIESWDFTDPSCPKNTLIKPSVGSIPAPKRFPFNPQGWRVKETCFDKGKVNSRGIIKKYLVEASGELLLVLRSVAEEVDKDGFLVERSYQWYHDSDERDWKCYNDELRYGMTVGFMVYKMNWNKNQWEPVESLGDKALFVGLNHSFSVSSHDSPQVMQNSIYFSDDMDMKNTSKYHPWGYDSGVYNMEDGFIFGILPSSLEEIDQPPLWVLPNPN